MHAVSTLCWRLPLVMALRLTMAALLLLVCRELIEACMHDHVALLWPVSITDLFGTLLAVALLPWCIPQALDVRPASLFRVLPWRATRADASGVSGLPTSPATGPPWTSA